MYRIIVGRMLGLRHLAYIPTCETAYKQLLNIVPLVKVSIYPKPSSTSIILKQITAAQLNPCMKMTIK